VKGGGHTGFPGASSIEGGITVALESMNEITLSKDKKTAAIGPGNRWGAVYTKLGEQNLAVIGGRASDVGLGLVLGGGISHHSNIYGFACDNVASFEVVLGYSSQRHAYSVPRPLLGAPWRRQQLWRRHKVHSRDGPAGSHVGRYSSSSSG
jgi:FAD/FMN-containing dehydrogenase